MMFTLALNQWTATEWIAAAAVFVSFVSSITGLYLQLRKMRGEVDEKEASTSKMVSEAAKNLIEPLNQRIDEQDETIATMKREICDLKSEVNLLSAGVDILTRQIISLGQVPHWKRDP